MNVGKIADLTEFGLVTDLGREIGVLRRIDADAEVVAVVVDDVDTAPVAVAVAVAAMALQVEVISDCNRLEEVEAVDVIEVVDHAAAGGTLTGVLIVGFDPISALTSHTLGAAFDTDRTGLEGGPCEVLRKEGMDEDESRYDSSR